MFFQSPPPPPPPRPMPITVFVHGTQFHTLVKDIDLRKQLPPVSQTPAGLLPMSALPKEHKIITMLETLSAADPQQFPFEGIYAFGWSGENLISKRRAAGQELFNLLKTLCLSYEATHGIPPILTIITHSHGGNVLLHMAEQQKDAALPIKRAILLACPVQEVTAQCIHHPCFERIYSFHSHDEWAQVADPQVIQSFREATEQWGRTKNIEWSAFKRLFNNLKSIPLFSKHDFTNPPFKLIQAAVHWQEPPTMKNIKDPGLLCEHVRYHVNHPFSRKKRGVFHLEFIMDEFIRHLPKLIKNAEDAGPVSGDLLLFIAG